MMFHDCVRMWFGTHQNVLAASRGDWRYVAVLIAGMLSAFFLVSPANGQCDQDPHSQLDYIMPPWPEDQGAIWGDMNNDSVVNHKDYVIFIKLATASGCTDSPDWTDPLHLIKTANTFSSLLLSPPTPPVELVIGGSMNGPYDNVDEFCSKSHVHAGIAVVFDEFLGRTPTASEFSLLKASNADTEPNNPCDAGPTPDPTDGVPDTNDENILCSGEILELPGGGNPCADFEPTDIDGVNCDESDSTQCEHIILCVSAQPENCNPNDDDYNQVIPNPEVPTYPILCSMAIPEDFENCMTAIPVEKFDPEEFDIFKRDRDYEEDEIEHLDADDEDSSSEVGLDDENEANGCGAEVVEGNEANGGTTIAPVDLRLGHKIEDVVDLRVKLPGPDYELRRHYTGSLHQDLVGPGWRLNAFMWANTFGLLPPNDGIKAPMAVVIHGYSGGSGIQSFLHTTMTPGLSNTYRHPLGSAAYMTMDGTTGQYAGWNTLKLIYPDRGEIEFEPIGSPDASVTAFHAPKYARDMHGNVRAYEYINLPLDSEDELYARRLGTINFYTGVGFTETPDSANPDHILVAKIRFRWFTVLHDQGVPASPLHGRLAAAIVYRPDPDIPGDWIQTQRVEYTYKWEWDRFSSHVANNDGSLVQVRRFVRVDSGWDGVYDIDGDGHNEETTPGFPHTIHVTQYRYHNGNDPFDETSEDPDPRFKLSTDTTYSGPMPLKMVIEHDTIERMAARWGATAGLSDPAMAVRRAAWTLLMKDDDETVYQDHFDDITSHVRPIDMASKIIGYDTTGTLGPAVVTTQYLRGRACGCGESQFRKQTYSYANHEQGVEAWRSTCVREYADFGSGMRLYRERFYDLHSPVSRAQLQRKYDTLIEYDPDEQGNGPTATGDSLTRVRTWVTEFLHDDRSDSTIDRRGNLIAVFPPGTMDGDSYQPLVPPEPPLQPQLPDCARHDIGSVRAYEYDAERRLTVVKVASAVDFATSLGPSDPVPGTAMRLKKYDSTSEPFVPTEQSWVFDPDAPVDGERSVWYGSNVFSQTGFRMRKIYIEAPTSDEGGPGLGVGGHVVEEPVSGNANIAYEIAYIYDNKGELIAIKTADGVLTALSRDQFTGVVTTITRNSKATVDPDGFGISGVTNDLPETTEMFEIDPLGRVVGYSRPVTMDVLNGQGQINDYVTRRVVRGYRTITGLPEMPYEEPLSASAYGVRLKLPHYLGDGKFEGPAILSWMHRDGRPIVTARYELGTHGISGDPYGSSIDPFEDLLENQDTVLIGLTAHRYNANGQRTDRWVWRDVAGGTRDQTRYEYDKIGRLQWTVDASGEWSGVGEYDGMNRPLTFLRGTSRTNALPVRTLLRDGDTWSAGVATRSDDGGNGWITGMVEHVSDQAADDRVTEYARDARGRLIQVLNPTAPHTVIAYNNLDEPVEAAEFGCDAAQVPSTPSPASGYSDRGAFVVFEYDQMGRVYSMKQALDPAQQSPAAFIESRSWFDAGGRVIAQASTGAPMVKLAYDAIGRMTHTFLTDGAGETLTATYSEAAGVATDEVVLEQTDRLYSATGLPVLTTHRLRRDDSSTDGPLENGSQQIAMYSGAYFDEVGRPISVVEFGTNASEFNYATAPSPWPPSSRPLASDQGPQLVTELDYDGSGRLAQITDPEGTLAKYWYDDSGRRIAVTENWSNAVLTGFDETHGYPLFDNLSDDQRTTGITYDGAGRTTHLVAYLADGAVQVTEYQYGVLEGADPYGADTNSALPPSAITSASLLSRVIYPDESTGLPDPDDPAAQEYFAYNRSGELIGLQDQNGTVHVFARDAAGRIEEDLVAHFATGVDDRIDRVQIDYDSFGRPQAVRSMSDTTTTENEVVFTYTLFGEIEEYIQNPSGSVDLQTSPRVRYNYDDGETGEGVTGRLLSITYPTVPTGDSASVSLVYGTTGSLDESIGRVIGLDIPEASGDYQLVRYEFLGFHTPYRTTYPVPDIKLDRSLAGDGSITPGLFPGFDRFGRTARHTWADTAIAAGGSGQPTLPPIIDRVLGYNKSSSLTHDLDGRPGTGAPTRDRLYEHDPLQRLTRSNLGATAGLNPAQFSPGADSEEWVLDPVGNWAEYGVDRNGDGTILTHDATYNRVNELIERAISGSRAYLFEYDANGNLIETTKKIGSQPPYAYSDDRSFKYDAWNRLVEARKSVGVSETRVVGEYEYNGLHQRVKRRADLSETTPDNVFDEERTYFYTPDWRLVEEHVDTDDDLSDGDQGFDGTVNRIAQQFWGLRYIDDAVARRIDRDADGGFDDVFFYLTDRQFSVSAIAAEDGSVVERVGYSPYGLARGPEHADGSEGETMHGYAFDVNGDGFVDGSDAQAIMDVLPGNFLSGGSVPLGDAAYDARLDVNRDGKIDFYGDYAAVYNGNGLTSPPAGWISDPKSPQAGPGLGPDNSIGYTGHVFDPETGLYLARFRHYSPELGRWMQRDPAGYVDGMNPYQYGESMPLFYMDPYGLFVDRILDLFDLAPPEVDEDLRERFCESLLAANEKGKLCGSNFERAWSENGCDGDGTAEQRNFWREVGRATKEGLHDGFLATLEGGSGLSLPEEWFYDPDDPTLETSRLMGFLAQALVLRRGGRLPSRCPLVCFASDEPVLTADGWVPLDQIMPGDRVLTGDWSDSTEVDPETWRSVHLHIHTIDGGVAIAHLLLPLEWLEENGFGIGSGFDLADTDLGLAGYATLLGVEPCPVIKTGPGRVVLGRFIRTPEQLIRLRLAGRDPPVEVTASHVLFSADRGDWAAAGDLAVGESIETLAGPARIEAIELADSRPLATLMVESEHLYIATEQGVLSENCGRRPNVLGQMGERWVRQQLERTGHTILKEQHRISTPHGTRIIDFLVQDRRGLIKAIESKWGRAARNASQRRKDEWIDRVLGIPTEVWRNRY